MASVSPFVKEPDRHAVLLWGLYKDYDYVDNGDDLTYIRAVGAPYDYYPPLIDTPRLFLDFARLVESNDWEQALSTWIAEYGLLGLSCSESGFIWEWAPGTVVPPLDYKDSGGPGDTIAAAEIHSRLANRLLLSYEACLNRDTETLTTLLNPSDVHTFPDAQGATLAELWREQNEEFKKASKSDKLYRVREMTGDMLVDRPKPIGWGDFLVDAALAEIWSKLVSILSVFAYPALTFVGPLPLTTNRLVPTMGARNLVGAMYLQFYWLLTSGEDLSRCNYCSRIISYNRPAPDSKERKPRKDKQFCDSRCRQNYHYHVRIKPTRRSEEEP